MMRFAFIGPAQDGPLLRPAIELALDLEADKTFYLGKQDELVQTVSAMQEETIGAISLLDQCVAHSQSPSEPLLLELLRRIDLCDRLESVFAIHEAPIRSVEVVDERTITFIEDKSCLSEDDIANSNIIVYASAPETVIKQFGPRTFFSPGPLSPTNIGVLERDDSGKLALAMYSLEGERLSEVQLAGRGAKMVVNQ